MLAIISQSAKTAARNTLVRTTRKTTGIGPSFVVREAAAAAAAPPAATRATIIAPTARTTGRCFSSKQYYKLRKKKKQDDNPFFVLGIVSKPREEPPSVPYADVKRRFLQLAMSTHPDTAQPVSPEQERENRDTFIAARMAFEAIVEGPEGVAVLRGEDEADAWKEDELDRWFRESTGHDLPFLDAATIREVAKMTEQVGDTGLDRDGGMWTLARMVSNSAKNGGDASSVLQLEAGTVRDRQINGVLRRRKRMG